MRYILTFTIFSFVFLSFGQNKLQTLIRTQHIPKSELTVKIDKSDYTLSVYHKTKHLVTYPCVFGFNAVDDKHQEGDGCTPEGIFRIRSKYPHGSWSYFIWIDYPNKESWRRFNSRLADGTIEKGATIGGEIGIHGVPKNSAGLIANKQNWTWGCISLNNEDIDELYTIMYDSMPIEITK